MFVNFFIDRPIFASVLAIVIVVAGAVAIPFLPIAMFPEITPPQVVVTATYPGASAEVVEQTVTTPIEQQVNGVEDMIYMSSRSGSDGTMTLNVTFKVGTDLDIAAVNVQNWYLAARTVTGAFGLFDQVGLTFSEDGFSRENELPYHFSAMDSNVSPSRSV